MYVLCSFLGDWSIGDTETMIRKPLTEEEAQMVSRLFPKLTVATGSIVAIQATAMPVNKLQQLPFTTAAGATKPKTV